MAVQDILYPIYVFKSTLVYTLVASIISKCHYLFGYLFLSSLQAKDKVISSLREGGKGEEISGISSSDYEEACREKEMIREELNQTKYRLEQLKGDLQVTILISLTEKFALIIIFVSK